MTHDEIGKALGLMPSELWRCVAIARNVEKMRGCADLWDEKVKRVVMVRGTGNTTGMLIDALVAVSNGQTVRISAYERAYQNKLVKQAQSWAVKLKLDPKLIVGFDHRPDHGRDSQRVWVDHYLGPAGMGHWESNHATVR